MSPPACQPAAAHTDLGSVAFVDAAVYSAGLAYLIQRLLFSVFGSLHLGIGQTDCARKMRSGEDLRPAIQQLSILAKSSIAALQDIWIGDIWVGWLVRNGCGRRGCGPGGRACDHRAGGWGRRRETGSGGGSGAVPSGARRNQNRQENERYSSHNSCIPHWRNRLRLDSSAILQI